MANTDLMRQLRDSEGYTVAQFAQAIGAVHYANYRRNRAADELAPAASRAVGATS
jgi:transcriptional regulator with XRE-family HTH domain